MRPARPFFLLKLICPGAVFRIRTEEKLLCLTFDDGPDPETTPAVLDILSAHDVKAVFFCLGHKAELHHELVSRIRSEGHITGNHGYRHLDGWKTNTQVYVRNFEKGTHFTSGLLLRPPHGRIRPRQYRQLARTYRVVLWDLMPWDFDSRLEAAKVLEILKRKIRPGSVIVLHDKASSSVLSFLDEFISHALLEGYNFTTELVQDK
ncbi:MAG: polysaccharide deacetylase family protein [Bacteroidales bacterium]|jgi:peptidoglycan/xylan/chitin deacetylase (PgdA/CDA1 family)|nr:polysaccharide deacetylase family protein [Bacteroidales bacterium]MDI9553007.1 polysaccharide deacetylase family protein [Bacteroidota bacterium]MBP7038268.1 polysaccharide deacetylase family protein [Bacteroidales bacterium]NLK53314.1 polysaccharide deacetylase family protein [Bacteroidales bacterium]HPB12883.1 polysaccharide deacetylase family protein [Bacteroidales bacterium]